MNELPKNISTVLKGIAILLIILSHIAGVCGIRYFTPLGGIGVSIFLFLSGYGLTESVSKRGLCNFWKRRIWTVMVPYLVIEISVLLVSKNYDFEEFIYSAFLIRPRLTQIWYLQYLMICYVIFWCVFKFITEEKRLKVLLLLFVLFFIFMPEIAAEQSLSFWSGCLFAKHKELFSKVKKFFVFLIIIGIIALLCKQFNFVRTAPQLVMNFVQLFIKFPCALGIIGIMYGYTEKLKLGMFKKIGSISYELYLTHINLLYMVGYNLFWGLIFLIIIVMFSTLLHLGIKNVQKMLV